MENAKVQAVVKALQNLSDSPKDPAGGTGPQTRTSLEDFIDWLIDWLLHPEYGRSISFNDKEKTRLVRVATRILDGDGDGEPQQITKDEMWLILIILILIL